MGEHEIMWIGRRPGTEPARALPSEDPAFETAVREACEAAGCPAERYVAARGQYGSWLVELRRAGEGQRLIWNGQAGRLSLDAPNPGGGWDEIFAIELPGADSEAVLAALGPFLGQADSAG